MKFPQKSASTTATSGRVSANYWRMIMEKPAEMCTLPMACTAIAVSLTCTVHIILTHSTHMYTLHNCNKHPHKTQGTFSLGMDIHHIQYVLHYIIIGPLTHITYKYTL